MMRTKKLRHPLKVTTALAAASLITGCNNTQQNGIPDSATNSAKPAAGVPENHGGNPKSFINCLDAPDRQGVPRQRGADPKLCTGKFSPEYFHVIYMKFSNANNSPFIARHAYFKTVSGQKDRIACALEYLEKKGSVTDDCGVVDDGSGRTIRENFDDLRYGSQQRVYAFVHNTNIAFNEKTPMVFTKWGAHDDQFATTPPVEKNPNLSFGGAQLVKSGVGNMKALNYNNYYKDAKGNDMATSMEPDTNYSINFNLLICKPPVKNGETCDFKDKDKVLPIAVDPDTGNGRGSRP